MKDGNSLVVMCDLDSTDFVITFLAISGTIVYLVFRDSSGHSEGQSTAKNRPLIYYLAKSLSTVELRRASKKCQEIQKAHG